MTIQTRLMGLPVQLLRDVLETKFKDNQAAMAKAMDVSPQRLQYLLALDHEGKGERFLKFLRVLCSVRRVLGVNWAVFGKRLESEVTEAAATKKKATK